MTHEEPQPQTSEWINVGRSMRREFTGASGQEVVEKLFLNEGVLSTTEKYPRALRHVLDVAVEVDKNGIDYIYQKSMMGSEQYVSFTNQEQVSLLVGAITILGLAVRVDPEIRPEDPSAIDAPIQLWYSKDAPLSAEFIAERAEVDSKVEFQVWQANAKAFVKYIQDTNPSIILSNKIYAGEMLQQIIDEQLTSDGRSVVEESITLSGKSASYLMELFKGQEGEGAATALQDYGFLEEFSVYLFDNNKRLSWQNLPNKDAFLDASLSVFIHKKIEELREASMSEFARLFVIKKFGTDSFEWVENEEEINSTTYMIEQLEEDDTLAMFSMKEMSQGSCRYGESVNILGNLYTVQRDGDTFSVELATPKGDGWTVRFPAKLDAEDIMAKIKDLKFDFREIQKDIPVELRKKAI